jgi:PAS domain S-box-containing protein
MGDAPKRGKLLQLGESTIRSILESAAQGILAINADGRLVLANNMALKMFGYNPNELLYQPLELLIPENLKHRHLKHQKGYFANPKNRPMGIGLDLEGRRKDGSRFPIQVSLSYVDTDEGRLGIAFIIDLTERKRAEELSHRSELLNRELIEHMSEGVAYCKMLFENGEGSDFVYLMVNQRFDILTGLKDVTGKRVTEVIPGIRELDPGVFEIYARVATTGIAETFEVFLNSLGQWYLISVYSPEKNFFVALFDVLDERKRMEDALRQSEERWRLAADSTGLGTFDFDPRTGKLIWSDVSKSYFGLPPDAEVDDATFRKGVHPEDRDRVQKIVDDAMRPESRGEYATEYRTIGINDGEERWISAWGRVLFDRHNQPERFIGLMLDISEKKRREKAAEATHNEIRALAASLLTAQEEERRRVSRELHDQICQQLAALAIDIGTLAATFPSPEDAQKQLKELQVRLVKAAEETRFIAYQLHPSVVDDLGLMFAMRVLCEEFSERQDIAVEFDGGTLPGSIPREIGSCLYRVAQESLQNIAKHAEAKHVSVTLSLSGTCLVLTIEDDGVGFDAEAVKGKGGLGLISMNERVRSVNGTLSIVSRLGQGARITVQIPVAPRVS